MKKCKNFLVTLIKLASSDPQAASMATNVRGLVGALLVRFPCSSFTVAASSSEVCRRVTPNRQKVGASAGWGVLLWSGKADKSITNIASTGN